MEAEPDFFCEHGTNIKEEDCNKCNEEYVCPHGKKPFADKPEVCEQCYREKLPIGSEWNPKTHIDDLPISKEWPEDMNE